MTVKSIIVLSLTMQYKGISLLFIAIMWKK